MRCVDSDSDPEYIFKLKYRIDKLTGLLCKQCKYIEKMKDCDLFCHELRIWWEDYKLEEERKIKREAEEKEEKRKIKIQEYEKLKKELGL